MLSRRSFSLAILALTLCVGVIGCSQSTPEPQRLDSASAARVSDSAMRTAVPVGDSAGETGDDAPPKKLYAPVSPDVIKHAFQEYPRLRDTAALLDYLVHQGLQVSFNHVRCMTSTEPEIDHYDPRYDTIGFYRKSRLVGLNEPVLIVEYKHVEGPNSCRPNRLVFVVRSDGSLLGVRGKEMGYRSNSIFLSAETTVLEQRKGSGTYFLHTVWESPRGHGGHELYSYHGNSFHDHMADSFGNGASTLLSTAAYFAWDEYYHRPWSMKSRVHDANRDGWNDLELTSWAINGNDHRTEVARLHFLFLYNPGRDQFIPAEDYRKKYAHITPPGFEHMTP